MNIVSYTVALILSPFVLLISFVFTIAYSWTGNYGISLILVSFCITFGTAPLYMLAERWKNDEKRIQKAMDKDLRSIKKNFIGQKRFYLTQAAHRIYHYSSVQTLRTSFGLLIQIPFFFAAYEVLSRYTGYEGVSFLFIRNLASPDGLLGGVNILPFVMTAINIALSFYYSRTFSFRANKELLVMSLLFLVLLYNSPAALLVYWTMNNVFSFIKAFALRHLGLLEEPVMDTIKGNEPSFFQNLMKREPAVLIFFANSLVFSLQVFWIVNFDETFKYVIVICGSLCTLSSFIAVYRWHFSKKIVPLIILWFLMIPVLYLIFMERRYNPYISNTNLKLLMAFLFDITAFAPLYIHLSKKKAQKKSEVNILGSFCIILFSLFFFIIVYQPVSYYLSAPLDSGVTPISLLTFIACAFSLPFCVLAILYGLLRVNSRVILVRLVIFTSLVFIAWSMILKLDVGMLDGFVFQKDYALDGIPLFLFLFDALILSLLWYTSGLIVEKQIRTIAAFSLCVTFLLAVNIGFKYAGADHSAFAKIEEAGTGMPESAYQNHRFSKSGKNIVFVIADMFNGNYIGRLTELDPVYKEKLEGFVWYPDTLSISYNTASTFPALFAGSAYLPIRLNNNGKIGTEEIRLAAANFFNAVKNAGYSATVANPIYFLPADTAGATIENIFAYQNYWRVKKGYPVGNNLGGSPSRLLMLSIFNAIPYHLKIIIYDNSSWIIYRKSALFNSMSNKAIRDLAYVDLLPEISSTGSEQNRFFYIHNELTHSNFGIDRDGNPVKGTFPDPEKRSFTNANAAFYSAKKEIDMLVNWFTWMKTNGVYDNTLIVIVSDHGNNCMDNGIKLPPSLDSGFGPLDVSRANTLLLVKDFGKKGILKSDFSLMSSADIPTIFTRTAGIVLPFREEKVRIFSSIAGDWESFIHTDTEKYRTYEVKGSIFDPDSWTLSSMIK